MTSDYLIIEDYKLELIINRGEESNIYIYMIIFHPHIYMYIFLVQSMSVNWDERW